MLYTSILNSLLFVYFDSSVVISHGQLHFNSFSVTQVRPTCDGSSGNSVHSSFSKGGNAVLSDRYGKWGLCHIRYVLAITFPWLCSHSPELVFKFPYFLINFSLHPPPAFCPSSNFELAFEGNKSDAQDENSSMSRKSYFLR